jgi:hypothetical protein
MRMSVATMRPQSELDIAAGFLGDDGGLATIEVRPVVDFKFPAVEGSPAQAQDQALGQGQGGR